jgi:hypothetical protein
MSRSPGKDKTPKKKEKKKKRKRKKKKLKISLAVVNCRKAMPRSSSNFSDSHIRMHNFILIHENRL